MMPSDFLHNFKHADPLVQDMIEAAVKMAYMQGRLDASADLTAMAIETDRRVREIIENPRTPQTTDGRMN
jgi:hypothetical protein